MLKRIIISASLLLASGLGLNAVAETDKEELKELIEQEFQTIDLDANEDLNDEDADGKFEFVDQSAQSSKTKQISVKNEFFESVKIILSTDDEKASIKNKEIYLNAYETNDSIQISKGIQYDIEVYNLYNDYLGYIYKANTKSKNKISISPFLLIKDKPAEKKKKPVLVNQEVKKQQVTIELAPVAEKPEPELEKKPEEKKIVEEKVKEIKESVTEETTTGYRSISESSNYSHEIITHKETEETKIFRAPEKIIPEDKNPKTTEKIPKLPELTETPSPKDITITTTKTITNSINSSNAKVRGIKVANISDEEIHINLIDPLGNPIGGGWTISNDVYVPQFLNFQSEPVHIEPNVKLLINNSKSQEIITKFAKDLNIDEKGNYVWFVD